MCGVSCNSCPRVSPEMPPPVTPTRRRGSFPFKLDWEPHEDQLAEEDEVCGGVRGMIICLLHYGGSCPSRPLGIYKSFFHFIQALKMPVRTASLFRTASYGN